MHENQFEKLRTTAVRYEITSKVANSEEASHAAKSRGIQPSAPIKLDCESLETGKTYQGNWSTDPYGYQWPANKLSRFDMARLIAISNQTKTPLNRLIKDAVEAYVSQRLKELDIELIREESPRPESADSRLE